MQLPQWERLSYGKLLQRPVTCCSLLQVLQVMDPPRRRIVIFKGGGYIYAEMEAMIQAAGVWGQAGRVMGAS